MNDSDKQPRAIFLAAIERPASEREEFIAQACGDDLKLHIHVERLLRSHEELGSFHEDSGSPTATVGLSASDMVPTQIGPYKLLQKIGEGGMGTVFMAEQSAPVHRQVALKVIKPGMDSQQVIARFEAERQALAMMDHVNIARVLDVGATEQGRPYFVMELVHGVPITKYCDDNHLTPRQRLEHFLPVCQAIQHAHQKGIIHRDIKPSNVMVTLYDGKPVPKVIDFGIAKAVEQKLTDRTLFTHYGMMVGTLEYMSPEQAEMNALGVDTRSDVYSLGVLLYELLTGSTPLSGKQLRQAAQAEIVRMIREDEPPKPSTRLSESGEALASISAQRRTQPARLSKLMRGELDWIVMKTLEKDRNRRYESASSFAADLQRYLNNEPVEASPPSSWYRARKYLRRHRGPIATAAVVASALIIGTGVSLWQATEARQSRNQANTSYAKARGTVKKLLAEVATNDVVMIPGMRELYLKLLDEARNSYEELVQIVPDDPAIHADLGELHRIRGQPDLAQQAFQRAVDLDPKNSFYHQELAGILVDHSDQAEEFQLGLVHATRALELGGSESACRLLRAIANARLGLADQAYGEMGEVEQLSNLTAADYRAMVRVCRHLEDWHQGKRYAKQAIAMEPANEAGWMELGTCCRQTGHLQEGVEAFTESLRLDRRVNIVDRSYKLEWRGDCYRCLGLNDEALADFREHMILVPDATHLFSARGDCEFRRGNYTAALAEFTSAFEAQRDNKARQLWGDPSLLVRCPDQEVVAGLFALLNDVPAELAVMHSSRANFRLEQGDIEGAFQDVILAAELNVNYVDLGNSAAVKSLIQKSEPYRDRLMPLVKKYENHVMREVQRLSALCNTQLTIGQSRSRKCRETLREVCSRQIESINIHWANGRQADAERAAGELAERLREFPTTSRPLLDLLSQSWCDLAYWYLGLGKDEQGSAAMSESIRLDALIGRQDNHEKYHARGDCRLRQKKYEEAIADFDEATKRNSKHTHAYVRRGLAHFQLGSFTAAFDDIGRAWELDPQDTLYSRLIPVHRLALALESAGRQVEARQLWQRLELQAIERLQAVREMHGEESEKTLFAMEKLAQLYEVQGKHEELKTLADKLLTGWQRQAVAHQIAVSRSFLGASYLGQGRLEQAEPLLLAGFEEINATRTPGYSVAADLSDAARRLAKLYEAKHDLEQAVRWQNEAQAALQIVVPKSSTAPAP